MTTAPVLLDSITDLTDAHRGAVVVSGSHGGLYPAALASRGGLRAVILNDAGRGYQDAGIAGVLALGSVGMAAAAADCGTCLIGSARDTLDHGRIGTVNEPARALGLAPDMSVAEAAARLAGAPLPTGTLPAITETRKRMVLDANGLTVALLDSASMVGAEDAGGVVVTGSHGALIGGDPARALKAPAAIAAFNDAGGGKDGIGRTRLFALAARGIAAVTVGHDTARIGDAASMMATGRISAANATAIVLGALRGRGLADWLAALDPGAFRGSG